MALRFMECGGGYYNTASLPGPWAAQTGTPAVTTGYLGFALTNGNPGNPWALYAPNITIAQGTNIGIGMRLKCSAIGSPAGWGVLTLGGGGAGHVAQMYIQANGAIQLQESVGPYLTTAAGVFQIGSWQYVEVFFSGGLVNSTTVTIRVGGVTVSGTNPAWSDLVNIENPLVNVRFGDFSGSSQGATAPLITDMYVLDSTGTVNTTLLGDQIVVPYIPSANGRVNQWTPLSGTNWSQVSHIPPPGDSDYVVDSTIGDTDCYAMSQIFAGSFGSVSAVQSVVSMRSESGSTVRVKVGLGNGSTEQYGATFGPGTSYVQEVVPYNTNPLTGVAFTTSDLPGLQGAQQISV